MVCGDVAGGLSDGMPIGEFDDNCFIVPFDFTTNCNANLSQELVPAVRTGNLSLEVEFNRVNTVPGLMVLVFAEFPCHMEINKDKNVDVSYTSKPKSGK